MITRPLDLQSRLSPPPRDLDFFAWVNAGVIVLFFTLLGSRFVLPPGTPVILDGEQQGTIVPPQGGTIVDDVGGASIVVSYRRDNVILFEGGMYTLAELRKHMETYAKSHPRSVILVRADRQVSMQAFIDLCEMARSVGFAKVVIAGEQPGMGER